jgi:hypothetical protein
MIGGGGGQVLAPVSDVSVAAWIAPRLGPFGGWVGSVVPQGFKSYARILHPVPIGPATSTTWAAVCASTGRRAHALMQWNAIAGTTQPGQVRNGVDVTHWVGEPPERGNLDPRALAALCEVLAGNTVAETQCTFALWDGYGWIHGSPAVAVRGSTESVPAAFPPEVLHGPRLHHPNRDYLLFTGPLHAAQAMGWHSTPNCFEPQSPNLFWPADHLWCVGSEIDFDSTLVAGSGELIDAILAAPELEAWSIGPDDSLAHDGDQVNGP